MAQEDPKTAENAYHAHRGRQRRRILDAAEGLFDERGIDRTTMAELIAASGIRPSTMYQYFANKDEIVWAIVGESMEKAAARATERMEGAGTGLAKISRCLNSWRMNWRGTGRGSGLWRNLTRCMRVTGPRSGC
jgi:AcrR family transcriptional regulator